MYTSDPVNTQGNEEQKQALRDAKTKLLSKLSDHSPTHANLKTFYFDYSSVNDSLMAS